MLQCGTRNLVLDRPHIMGILNVTPDSFSDGGQFLNHDAALKQVEAMISAGASIIDIGGESTRPGAADVSEQEELDRVLPVLGSVLGRFDVVVSVDTSKPAVMRDAAAAGAGMLNDVRALQEPGALEAAAHSNLPVCLMHMRGKPRTMQNAPEYSNVVQEVADFLKERVEVCRSSGIDAEKILIDPGFGFGKTLSHNVELLRNLGKLVAISPVLTGLSRKRMIGGLLGDDEADRTIGSVIAATLCVQHGASIVRVHDVAETAQALTILTALKLTE